MILCDTGPLVAAFNEAAPRRCVRFLQRYPERSWYVPRYLQRLRDTGRGVWADRFEKESRLPARLDDDM